MLEAGSLLNGRYHVEAVVGEGGMGVVYRARADGSGGQLVAVKELALTGGPASECDRARRQFREEARILGSLVHPGLVDVIDFFEVGDRQYLVMSYVNGRRTDEVVREMPAVDVDRVTRWAMQICDVLEYLHGLEPPVVFRDLKPGNILVDMEDRIRLIDFGISRFLQEGSQTSTYLSGSGTAGFAPIEQYTGGTDLRTDIYSLGATMYALLTLTVPPTAVSLLAGEKSLTPVGKLNSAVPPALEAVILRMMAPRKEDRYPTVLHAREALSKSSDSGGPMETRVSILVADDEPHILRPLTYVLERAGYCVIHARNGVEALQGIRDRRPQVAFLDIMMPRMSGYEVCRAVRDDAGMSGTRIVFLSAKGQEADVERGLEAGADDYITKPFSPSVVLSKVQELLSRQA